MMKSDNIAQIRICTLCGEAYTDHPAISRTDNETPICPRCGTRQALDSIGISSEEQERIIAIIYKRRC